jgi:hypothetical protein
MAHMELLHEVLGSSPSGPRVLTRSLLTYILTYPLTNATRLQHILEELAHSCHNVYVIFVLSVSDFASGYAPAVMAGEVCKAKADMETCMRMALSWPVWFKGSCQVDDRYDTVVSCRTATSHK